MRARNVFLAMIFLLGVIAPGCSSLRGTSLNLTAGLVYKVGGTEPVARTKFFLLDRDAISILKEGGINTDDQAQLIINLTVAFMDAPYKKDDAKRAAELLSKHTKYTLETDFEGRAHLDQVSSGSYFVFGSGKHVRVPQCGMSR